ncbi:MAG TPA: NAD(P)/FAD-dependent oxidoreductase [Pyrinomonadaceae bacterium]|nr:NAD(P)/FAD-dependent oxidoreductase [Pyrinomonadaceae bacterium]
MRALKTSSESRFSVAIVGAGPAGASLAIRLARDGSDVTLIERATFPRQKLCGEFISPECMAHFDHLGVLPALSAVGQRIFETRFYLQNGQSFQIPSDLLLSGGSALGVSRAQLDLRLLEAARAAGARVIEGHNVNEVVMNDGRIAAVKANAEQTAEVAADIFVDATGRQRILSKLTERLCMDRHSRGNGQSALAVAFKNHLSGVSLEPGICEIYFFRGGYAGISGIENGLANVCLMVEPAIAKKFGGRADEVIKNTLAVNRRAGALLDSCECRGKWLAVSLSRYGRVNSSAPPNLLSVGDAEAFIDPFTGSGILMALEGSNLLASAIKQYAPDVDSIGTEYRTRLHKKFNKRLQFCSVLRRLASLPMLPSIVFRLLESSPKCRTMLASATRRSKILYSA